ncbi:hypothetical protein BGZ54_009237 [Gamsiella multidivaricata]|nr:hypothetical protein BGZ54_009237 [Gamsiella multidivaricata]
MRPHLMTMTRLEDYANHLNCMAKMITEQTLPQLFRDHSLAMNDLQHDISGMASRDQARLSERLSGLRAKFSDIPEAVESTPQDPHPNKVESEEEKRTGQEHQHKYKDEEYFANLEVSQLSEFTSQGLDIDARVSTTTNPLRKKARLDQDDSGVRSQQDDYGGTEQSQADQHFELSDYLITQEIWTSSCIAGSHQQAMGPCSAAVSMETDNVNVRKHKRSDESDLTSSSPLKSQNYLSGNVTSQSATQQTNTIDPNNLQRATSAYQSTSSISENQASHSKAAKTAKSAFKEQTMVQQHEQDTPETKESFTRGVMISNWNIVLSDHIHCLLECSNYARMYVQLDTPRVFMGMEQTANTLPSSQGSVLSSYERPHAQGTLSNTPTGPSQAQQRAQQLRSKVAAEVALLAKGANEIFSAITKYHAVRSGLLLKIERERAAMNNRGQHSGYVRALEQQVEFLDYRHAHRLWLWGLDMQSSCVVLYRVLRTMLPRLGSRSRV